eukprot:Skav203916  [mRNA]  locus=scaffold228:279075:279827:+ [translate_table: standard]
MSDHAGDTLAAGKVDLDLVQRLLGVQDILEGMQTVEDAFIHGVQDVMHHTGFHGTWGLCRRIARHSCFI